MFHFLHIYIHSPSLVCFSSSSPASVRFSGTFPPWTKFCGWVEFQRARLLQREREEPEREREGSWMEEGECTQGIGELCRGRVLLFATNKNIKTAVEVVSSSSFFDVSKRLRSFMEFDIFQFSSRLVFILLRAKKKLFFFSFNAIYTYGTVCSKAWELRVGVNAVTWSITVTCCIIKFSWSKEKIQDDPSRAISIE